MRVDKSIINTMNKRDVLNIIRNNGTIFRAEIARLSGLSMPTIMKIADNLIELGLIREIGKGESSGGKPPKLLEFVADSYYCVGIDLGTTKITGVVLDFYANIIYKKTVLNDVNCSVNSMIERICNVIDNTLSQPEINRKKIIGIGIGMPGLVDNDTREVLFSPNLGWENVDLVGIIHERFGLPVMIENVTRAMAMGESHFGIARKTKNFICVNLGYGIGSAMMINGELYSGTTGTSGELGHVVIDPVGPKCECGNRGCIEAISSAKAITNSARKRLQKGETSILTNMCGNDLSKIEAKTVFEAARQGDLLACDIINNAIEYLGIGLALMINLLDPQYIILEGGMANAGEILTDKLEKTIAKHRMKHAGMRCKMVVSEFGADAAAIGGASLILNKFIEQGGNLQLLNS